ncbi:MAG TPA: DUF2497 domain-containing protein [Rhodopila sp.]|jgi:hypothetical protein|nr:DUF2497 domain-containing protein [Rhodopila sp.]
MTTEPPPPTTPEGTDPSMEEILASIRRILNDDDVPAEPAEEPAAMDDVLVLDESMLASEAAADHPAPEPAIVADEPDVAAHEVPVTDLTPYVDARERPAPTPGLVAPETAAAAASSVDNLVRTLAAGRVTQVYAGGPTLEDMVRSELRPLLKEWLDAYLPSMVERLVRTEIERVVGREFP